MIRRSFLSTMIASLAALFGVRTTTQAAAPTLKLGPHREDLVVTRNGRVTYASSIVDTWFCRTIHMHADTVATIGLVDTLFPNANFIMLQSQDILHALRYEEGVTVNLYIGDLCYKGVVRGNEPPELNIQIDERTTCLRVPVKVMPG